MTWHPNISSDRREAIGRAGRAVVRLAADPAARDEARSLNAIVADVTAFDDWQAWDAMSDLEHMVIARGLVSAQQLEAEARAAAVPVLMGDEVQR